MRFYTLLFFLIVISYAGKSQYLANPSFEGTPTHFVPPPPWDICDPESTPDTQPGWWGCYGPASDGNTYLGMITRGPGVSNANTWEDVHVSFVTPLSTDTCYLFSIDLRFDPNTGFNGISLNNPVTLKIYGEQQSCNKEHLLWESGPISDLEWVTHTFLVQPEFEITELVMEVYYVQMPQYFGHMLIDNIVIQPTPKIDLGNDTTVAFCPGGYFPIGPGGGYADYLWQDGNTDSIYQVVESGNYWVNVVDAYGCSASDSITVTVEDYIDLTSEMLDEVSVCEGQELELNVAVNGGLQPYQYLWNPGEEGDTTATITITPEETTMYYVAISDSCGTSITDSILVDISPAPVIDLSDTTVCGGEEVVLDAGAGFSSYLWNDGSTGQTLNVTQAGTYWVQVTNAAGCSATQEINVSFYPAIELNLGNDTILCAGETLLLTAPPGMDSYLWQDGSTGQNLEVAESGEYWVNVVSATGCTASDTIEVSFEDETTVDLGPDTTLCYGTPYILSPGNYNEYEWQDGSNAATYTVTQAGTYSVNVLGGCGWASDEVTISYFDEVTPDLGPDTTICYDQEYILNPGNYPVVVWQDGSMAPVFQVFETGYYSVTVTTTDLCEGSDEVFVRVGQKVQLPPDTSICEGDSILVSAGSDYDYFEWTLGNSSEIIDTTSSLMIHQAGTYVLNAGIDNIECSSSDSIHISSIPIAEADIEGGNICEGDTLTLQVAADPSYEYFWNDEAGSNELNVSEPGTYVVKVGNQCGYAYDTAQVIVFPLPEVDLGENQFLYDENSSVLLDAGEGFVSYQWQDGSTRSSFLVSFEDALHDSVYFVKVFDGNCFNSDTVIVETGLPEVPNVITPNGDGHNDIFRPSEKWGNIHQHTIIVFNRWGEKIWESSNFPGGWDGTDRFGRKVADGTYFWVLTVQYDNGIKKIFRGSLSVLGD